MAVTIIECLQNARANIDTAQRMPQLMPLVKDQLNNAIELLDKGYGIDDEVEPLLEKYGSVEAVPEKSAN